MNISIDASGLQSMRQALGIANIRTAMKQDAQSIAYIVKNIEELTAKTMEMSVTPHKGSNIDIRV